MSTAQEYDVAIVGASIAGCATSILLAKRGARVGLIEQQHDWRAYKKVCSHFIQASATHLIERIGLASRIEAAGGLRNYGEFWTEWGGSGRQPLQSGDMVIIFGARRWIPSSARSPPRLLVST